MKKRSINYSFDDLYIQTHLVGYNDQGESCVFFVYSLKPHYKIHYAMVIDSYEKDKNNRTLDILQKYIPNQKLDMLVWTHPHDDHLLGLDKIINGYCDKNTRILIPCIGNNPKNYSRESNEMALYLSNLNKGLGACDRYDINAISMPNNDIHEVAFTNNVFVKSINVSVIAPYSNIGYVQCAIKDEIVNRISIGLIIQVALKDKNMNFLYTGDMDHMTIEEMLANHLSENYDSLPTTYTYVKIPHHGSESSLNLINLFAETKKIPVACTTIFASKNLPRKEAIDNYVLIADNVISTSGKHSAENYGEIITKYNIITEKYDIQTLGKALEY